MNNCAQLLNMGALVVASTDAGWSLNRFGEYWIGMELLVRAGATPLEALTTGTRIAAKAVGLADKLGTLGPGKIADLTVVGGCRAANHLPPGVAGLTFDEMAELVGAMHRDDARTNWETLRIIGDELWNFADGTRTLSEIAEAIGFEFGVEIHPQHFLTLARGLQKAGVFTLRSIDR